MELDKNSHNYEVALILNFLSVSLILYLDRHWKKVVTFLIWPVFTFQ